MKTKSRIHPYLKELAIMATVLLSFSALAAGGSIRTHLPQVQVSAISSDGQPVANMSFTFSVNDQKYGWHSGMNGNVLPQYGDYTVRVEEHVYATQQDGSVVIPAHDIATNKLPYIQGVGRGYFNIAECGTGGYNTLHDVNTDLFIAASECEFSANGAGEMPEQIVCKLNATSEAIRQAYAATQTACIARR